MKNMEVVKKVVVAILIFPLATFILSIAAGEISGIKPMFVLAALALLASMATVLSLDVIYRSIGVESKDRAKTILVPIFVLLAYPYKDISLYLLLSMGVSYSWLDEILGRYFYTSYLISGFFFNVAIRI